MTQATDTDIREIRDLLLSLDKKIDINIAKTEEQFKSLDIQISDLKRNTDTKLTDIKTEIADIRLQLRAQEGRLWTFVGALFVAVLGFLAKFAFFPGSQL